MKCTNCTIKPICTVYSTVIKHSTEIGIQINFCNYHASLQNMPIKENAITEASKPRRTPEQILETSDQIRKIYNSTGEKKEPEVDESAKCSVCGGKKEQHHIHYVCSSCEKQNICENCTTESIADLKMYCPECWEKME